MPGTIFSRQTMKTAIGKRHGAMSKEIIRFDQAMFESELDAMVRERVGESLIDMYLAGVSTRQVDDISQLLWGDRMPSQTLSDKLKRVYAKIDEWRTRPLEGEYPYVFVDGAWSAVFRMGTARIRYVTANEWSARRYLDMSRLDDTLQAAN